MKVNLKENKKKWPIIHKIHNVKLTRRHAYTHNARAGVSVENVGKMWGKCGKNNKKCGKLIDIFNSQF
jgi:hypothetical protein